MWRRFVRIETGIFLVLWIALLCAGRSAMLRDPGTFWHVVTGNRILDSGAVPRTDPFSFTRAGQLWVVDQGWPECAMAAIHRIAGWDGLLLVTAAVLATVYTWLACRLLRSGLHPLPGGLVLAAAILAGSPQFHVRPLILTLGLQGVVFAWLIDIEAGRRGRRQLWWLVPLFVIWANCHGGVLAGVGTAGLCVCGWCAAWMFGKESPVRTAWDALEMLLFLAAMALAMLVNPYGVYLPKEWWETLSMPLQGIIDEHTPLDFANATGFVSVAIAVAYLIVLRGTFPRWPRVTWLLPLVWFALAIQRVRNVPLMAVTVVVALADLLPHSRMAEWLSRHDMFSESQESAKKQLGDCPDFRPTKMGLSPSRCPDFRPTKAGLPPSQWLKNRLGSILPLVLPLVVVIGAFLMQAAGIAMPVAGRGWARFDPARWPIELLPQLTEIDRANPEGTPIFNDLNFGGFLIYHTPRLRVFVDDRCSLYGGDFLQTYNDARQDNPTLLDAWWQRYRFPYALVETGGGFDHHLSGSGQWTLLGRTPVATLYQRDLGTSAAERYTGMGGE